MKPLEESPDDIADREAGDLDLACLKPLPRRRHKSRPGRTAQLSPRRKAEFVIQALLNGRGDSATAQACLDQLDRAEVLWRILRRALRNPKLAILMTDGWKREAAQFTPPPRRRQAAKAQTP